MSVLLASSLALLPMSYPSRTCGCAAALTWAGYAPKISHLLLACADSESACDFNKNQCQAGAVCAEYVPGQETGHCVNATVKFVPSYSTHLECKVGGKHYFHQMTVHDDLLATSAWFSLEMFPQVFVPQKSTPCASACRC